MYIMIIIRHYLIPVFPDHFPLVWTAPVRQYLKKYMKNIYSTVQYCTCTVLYSTVHVHVQPILLKRTPTQYNSRSTVKYYKLLTIAIL